MISDKHPTANAALFTLITLQLVMLAALFAGVPPHPPVTTPLFGIGPFLGMSLSTTLAAVVLKSTETKAGSVLCVLAAFMALVSFGPQKYFDPQLALIWPAVITGQIAAGTLILQAASALRHKKIESNPNVS